MPASKSLGSKQAEPSRTGQRVVNGIQEVQSPQAQPDTSFGPRLRPPYAFSINSLPWTATGVIKNLPARSPGTPTHGESTKPDGVSYAPAESADQQTAKVLHHALKDVLKTVKDATARVRRKPFTDFDPLTLNFPALCLRILPSPPMLFSSTPVPSDLSWPLQPPHEGHRDLVRREIFERMESDATNNNELFEKCLKHLDSVYRQWTHMNKIRQEEVWHMEIMRSYAVERNKRVETERKLENALFEMAQLRSHFRAIKNARFPGEEPHESGNGAAETPLSFSYELSAEIARELDKHSTSQWDYDRVVERWSTALQEQEQPASSPSSHSASVAVAPDSRTRSPATAISRQQAGGRGQDSGESNTRGASVVDVPMVDVIPMGQREPNVDGGPG